MKRYPLAILLAALVGAGVASGQAQPPTTGVPFRIEKLDPAFDEIVAPDAMLETLGDRFALTEGPVWVPEARTAICSSATTRAT